MRDVAIVSCAYSAVPKELRYNEVEMIVPVIRQAMAESGLRRDEIGFTCSGSLDYLQGGPFSFVMGLDAVGAWPPIRESHVEMDGAWALYEAWVAIQTGEVDTALVYGFGKASQGDVHEIMTLQYDPYYLAPLWPSMVDVAALQARAYLEASGRTERDLAEVAAAALRNAVSTPQAVRSDAGATADALLAEPMVADPLRAVAGSRRGRTPAQPSRAHGDHPGAGRAVVRVVFRPSRQLPRRPEPAHHRAHGAAHQGRAQLGGERAGGVPALQR